MARDETRSVVRSLLAMMGVFLMVSTMLVVVMWIRRYG